MRIVVFQHVSFEGPANILEWAKAKKAQIQTIKVHQEDTIWPKMEDFDFLIVMGGPMSANDEAKFPWLIKEKKFIAEAIAQNKKLLGICLGAQLVANVLGAKVYKNPYREVGWFPLETVCESQ